MKKILLLGEFSGFHNNLKDGLVHHGFDVDIAGFGDGYKNINVDVNFSKFSNKYLDGIYKRYSPLRFLSKLNEYDVVQIMNPFIFNYRWFPTELFYNRILDSKPKVFLNAAGTDALNTIWAQKNLAYNPYEDYIALDLKRDKNPYLTRQSVNLNKLLAENVDGIIPSNFDYTGGYEPYGSLRKCIPFPVNLKKINFIQNKLVGRLKFFHGVSRYGFKGTKYIEGAFTKAQRNYGDRIICTSDGQLPLIEYLKVLGDANVVLDQCNSYGYGMNAVFAMAMGKVVLSGSEIGALDALGIDKSPVINIRPDEDHILSKIEYVLSSKTKLEQMGLESRNYAEQVHDCNKVALRYLAEWEK